MKTIVAIAIACLWGASLSAQETPDQVIARLRAENDSLRALLAAQRGNVPSAPASRDATAASADSDMIPTRPTERHEGVIDTKFDRFDQKTTVSLGMVKTKVKMSLDDIYFGGFFTYPGETPSEPGVTALHLVSRSKEWQFLRCRSLALLVDGELLRFDSLEHDGKVGSGYVLEQLFAMVTKQDLLRIANAKQVEGKLCSTEFSLDDKGRIAWRDFASRLRAP